MKEHERARLKLEEGVRLALELRNIVEKEKEHHAQLKAEEEAHLDEEARLKSEEEELLLKYEDEARLVAEARLKSEQEE